MERRTEVGGTTDQKGGTADQQGGTADWPVLIRSPFGLFAAPAESPFGPLCPFLMALCRRDDPVGNSTMDILNVFSEFDDIFPVHNARPHIRRDGE